MTLLERHTMHTFIWNWVIKARLGHHKWRRVSTCVETLRQWQKRMKKINSGIPMIWCETRNHANDCYFCITSAYGFTYKTKHKIQCPDLDSVILLVLNFSFLSEADEVTDPDFWDISEISTSSSTSTVPFSQNSMSWCVTSLFLKYLPSFWLSG